MGAVLNGLPLAVFYRRLSFTVCIGVASSSARFGMVAKMFALHCVVRPLLYDAGVPRVFCSLPTGVRLLQACKGSPTY